MQYDFSHYRTTDMERKLQIARFCPLDIMITGVTGAGKSTTLNSIFHKTVAKVGDGVDPETKKLGAYRLNSVFRFWDTPGLGDGIEQDQIHQKKIIDLLKKNYSLNGQKYGLIDMALIVIEGIKRDMGTTFSLLKDIIVPNIQSDRILVVINQADVAMKGRHWQNDLGCPDDCLNTFLEEQALTIQQRIKKDTGICIPKPVCYSAEYGFRMNDIFDLIIDRVPLERRPCNV